MSDGARRTGDVVVTPHVVGMPVDQARDVAMAAGLVLAQPDADGPPLAELTWRQQVTVTGQHPPAGTPLHRWDSLVVTWAPGGSGVREPRRPAPRTSSGAGDAASGTCRGRPPPDRRRRPRRPRRDAAHRLHPAHGGSSR